MKLDQQKYDNNNNKVKKIIKQNPKDNKQKISKKMNRTITLILKDEFLRRESTISKQSLIKLQHIFEYKKTKIYHHQILLLYHHLSFSKNQMAFKILDPLIFPNRNIQYIIQPTLLLACKRLLCLFLYQMPYKNWLNKVRQLLQEQDDLSLYTLKQLFILCKLNRLNFISLYNQSLMILDQTLDNYSIFEVYLFQKYLTRVNTNQSKNILQRIYSLYDKKQNFLFNYHQKAMLKYKTCNQRWLFYYLLRAKNLPLKKIGFLLLYRLQDTKWKQWLNKNYKNEQIYKKMPISPRYFNYQQAVSYLFSNIYCQRNYLDQFYQFQSIQIHHNIHKIQLKVPVNNYNSFLSNAFFYLDSATNNIDDLTLHKIQDVLRDIRYLRKNNINLNIYLSVRLKIIYYSKLTKQQRYQKQLEVIKLITNIFANINLSKNLPITINQRILPMRSIRSLGLLEFQIYQTEQFQLFFQKYMGLVGVLSTQSFSFQNDFSAIKKIINQYQQGNIHPQNKLLYSQFRRGYNKNMQDYEIFYSNEVQINSKINVDYLIKIINKETKRQYKILTDFYKVQQQFYSIYYTKYNNLWKEYYLKQWCKLQYKNFYYKPIIQFISGEQFINVVKYLQNNQL